MSPKKFQLTIYQYYKKHKRDLPWRQDTGPYSIFVSEVMLQQTQVRRVIPKFELFLKTFPTFKALAKASIKELLTVWQGLGYNRRALNMQKAAAIISEKYKGRLPQSLEALDELPGIGQATAASIYVYTFNKPAAFIETNIRTVFIHHFFKDKTVVTDTQLLPFVEETQDLKNPREWYWALMDYGTYLKSHGLSHGLKSAQYTKQSPLKGSNREVRGAILKTLTTGDFSEKELVRLLKLDKDKIKANLPVLTHEGFIAKKGELYSLRVD